MSLAHLTDRVVISVFGDDAANFLAGLVTCAVDGPGAHYGALLTPQGKIIADFMLVPTESGAGYLIDAPRAIGDALLKRLTLYKLRAKVALADVSGDLGVFALWGASLSLPPEAITFVDPRYAPLGRRALGPLVALGALCDASAADYDSHRIALAVPQGGRDFVYGDAFPHEACMDELNGVDFQKGCYVGQEVVSRTQHRGSARSRAAALRFTGAPPSEGAEIKAGEKTIGRVGSVDAANGRGIALLRLDRLADAFAAKHSLMAGETTLRAEKPAWAGYAFPEPTPQITMTLDRIDPKS